MATFARQTAKKQPTQKPEYGVYSRNMISMKIHLKMSEVGSTTKQNLERKILQKTEGKCIPEGYVRQDSVKIISYSSGVIKMNVIEFQVVFDCLICNPVEGMIVECNTKTITKAGIHAEVVDDKGFMPMKVFVARDHNYQNRLFGDIKENVKIKVSIIGKRFELNDPYIVAIASLFDKDRSQAKPRIRVLDEPVPANPVDENPVDETPYDEDDDDVEQTENKPAPISIPTIQKDGELEEGEEVE
jgi:DNA-directed RNA polymerase subunit E'/Rpb7